MTHILVIDDDQALIDEIVDNLNLNGYDATGVTSSLAAITIAQEIVPDLIVCDVMMPDLDGYGVLLEMRAHVATASIPFVFLTARAEYQSMRQGMELGANDYIVKPFRFSDLIHAIEAQLNRYHQIRTLYAQETELLRQQVDTEHEKLAHQVSMMAMVTHDLKTMISAVMSSAYLVRVYNKRMSADRQHQHLLSIENTARRMNHMVEDLSLLGRMQHEVFEMERQEVDLVEVCRQVIELLNPTENPTHRISLNVYARGCLVMGDPRLIMQAVLNLVSNAIKYSPDGSAITINVSNGGGMMHIEVIDQGIGIPDDDYERLFAAFSRASNVAHIPGSGLGLTIVKRTAEIHRGAVTFTSQTNKGSTFTLSLPSNR